MEERETNVGAVEPTANPAAEQSGSLLSGEHTPDTADKSVLQREAASGRGGHDRFGRTDAQVNFENRILFGIEANRTQAATTTTPAATAATGRREIEFQNEIDSTSGGSNKRKGHKSGRTFSALDSVTSLRNGVTEEPEAQEELEGRCSLAECSVVSAVNRQMEQSLAAQQNGSDSPVLFAAEQHEPDKVSNPDLQEIFAELTALAQEKAQEIGVNQDDLDRTIMELMVRYGVDPAQRELLLAYFEDQLQEHRAGELQPSSI